MKAASDDKRYSQAIDRSLLRFSTVFKRGKAAADLPQRTFGFGDNAKDQGDVARSWIECDAGNYVAGRGDMQMPNLRV